MENTDKKEYLFRDLRADEIDVRIAQVTEDGISLLLYKDARCDMNILDEKFGNFGWDRDHKELKGNIYCGIGIWNEKQNRMVWKWDAGKETFTESEKGEASDSFKRAGFNWGIGRELYTSPFIWIPKNKLVKFKQDTKGKWVCKDNFIVEAIEITDKVITGLAIKNLSIKISEEQKTQRVFVWKRG